MLKDRSQQVQSLVRLADAVVTVLAFFLAYWIRSKEGSWPVAIPAIESISWMLGASIVLHFLLYPLLNFYTSIRLKNITHIIAMVFKAFLAEFFILGSLVFFFQAKSTSRSFFALYLGINYGLTLVEKLGARIILSSIRRRGYNFRQILIAGTGHNAERVIQALRRNKHWGYVPCGLLREAQPAKVINELDGVPVWGELTELEQIIKSKPVDELFFALDRIEAEEIFSQVSLTQKLGIPARLSLGLFDLPSSKFTFTNLETLPIVTFYTTLMTPVEAMIKRFMDITIALIGLAITAALYPWISYRIRKESPGPVFFKQYRVGENGRRFKCYKFRTMLLDAELRRHELASSNLMQGPMFKIENDPRVFAFGALLRKTSLDELPQFLNILRGDMSVVGTRPPTPDEVERYETHYRRRLSIRPGLTGLWQVSGRNQVSRFEDILALDLQYIDRWSIWLDVQIILRTIWVAVFRKGAY